MIRTIIKQLIIQQCINAIYDKIIFNFSNVVIKSFAMVRRSFPALIDMTMVTQIKTEIDNSILNRMKKYYD